MWLKITGFLFYVLFIVIAIVLGIFTSIYSFKAYSALNPEPLVAQSLKTNLYVAKVYSTTITSIILLCLIIFIITTLVYYGLNLSFSTKTTDESSIETASSKSFSEKTQSETNYQFIYFISIVSAFVSLIGITFLTVTFIAINVLLQLATALPNTGITNTRNYCSFIVLYSSLTFLSTLIAGIGLIVFISFAGNLWGASDEELKLNQLDKKLNEKINKIEQKLGEIYEVDRDEFNMLRTRLNITETDKNRYYSAKSEMGGKYYVLSNTSTEKQSTVQLNSMLQPNTPIKREIDLNFS